MRTFTMNPYYNPSGCGLEIVETNEALPDYDFDMVVLWRDLKSGKLYWGADSGCSCPAPFEQVQGLDDLNEYELTKEAYANAVARVKSLR